MIITQSWKRNESDSVAGHSITVKITYSSSNQSEIDELENRLPKGIIIARAEMQCIEKSVAEQ